MAVADYVYGKGSPPEILQMAIRCEKYNCLPLDISLLDHPEWLLERMNVAKNVYKAISLYKQCPAGKEDEFAKQYPQAWSIYKAIRNIINA